MVKKLFLKLVFVVCAFLLSQNAFSRIITVNVNNGKPDGSLHEQTENVVVGDVIRWVNDLNYTLLNNGFPPQGQQSTSVMIGQGPPISVTNIAPGNYYEVTITSETQTEIMLIHNNWTTNQMYNTRINLNFEALGVNDKESIQLKPKAYPNPCIDFLTVTSNETIESIELLDSIGRLLFTKKSDSKKLEENINMSNFSSGKYILRIRKNDAVSTVNIIKK